MASPMFVEHEKDFAMLTADITRRINTTIPGLPHDSRAAEIRQTGKLIDEANEILEQMEVEFRSHSASVKPELRGRLSNYKKEIQGLEKDLKKANAQAGEAARDELLNMDEFASSSEQKQRLLGNTERLERGTETLRQGNRLAIETEEIGIGVLNELDRQRNVLQRAKDKLTNTDVTLKKSGLVLKRMLNRAIQNKIVMAVIILIIIGVIAGVIYWKVSHSKSSSPTYYPPATTTAP